MQWTFAVGRCSAWIVWGLATLSALASIGRGDDRILVSGAIADRPATFALDTGAGLPFVAVESKVEAFALADRSPPPGDAESMLDVVGVARAPSVTLFGKTYPDVRFHLIAAEAPNVLNEFDAIIGWPAVRKGVLRLELGDNIATFHDTAPNLPRGWKTLPIIPADVLVIDTGSPAKPFPVLVDTGLDDGVRLGATEWARWTSGRRNDRYALDAAYAPGQGILVRKQYFARRFKLGGLTLHNVMVSEATELEQRIAGAKVDAVVGVSALRHLKMSIDGGAGVVHVRDAKKRGARQNYNRLGAVFVPHAGDFSALLATVAPGSPAASIGIRDGDMLVEVDGRPAAHYLENGISFSSLWNRAAGTRCTLTVRRGEQVLSKDVVLENYLD